MDKRVMPHMRNFLAALACVLFALPALANEARIREVVEAKLGGARVQGVQPTPIPGIFEVRIEGRDVDLTEERLLKLSAIDFSSLPLELAVKVQRGNGRRAVAMFTDPYCPYCRRLEQVLLQMDDITVYVFMYPVIRPQNADHSRAVWCSKDRAKAWLELAAGDRAKVPAAAATCANPVDKVLELGRTLRVSGTPTLFFANGERASGMMEIGQLRTKLDESARHPAKKN
jgi:thiol:disulfide interchange protein DsbC